MALLEMGGRKFTIPAGEVVLGSDADCAIQLSGPGVAAKAAILNGLPDGQVSVRRAVPEAIVSINGVKLGAEPTPLLHGDKVEVGEHELTFVDERRSGSTQYVAAMDVGKAMAQAKASAGKPTGNTGGRIVSLTDGREYAVTGASLVFGREAGCDVVVSGKDVSRRHAEIVTTPKGYMVVDSSTNGTFVNEERVEGQRLLLRADVIRIGDEQFRFYADTTPAAPAVPTPSPGPAANPPQAAPPVEAAAAPPVPSGAGQRLQNTSFGMAAVEKTQPPPTKAPVTTPALGNFLFRSGALKGQRYQIRTPILNIGRAEYNDLNIPDASVSTSHAKLQRREGVWVLLDLESTNGTFVDGEKVSGETPLAPGAMVRFGDIQMVFEPTDDALGTAKGGGTKVIEAFKPGAPPPAKPAAPAPAAPAPTPAPAAKKAAAASPAPPAPVKRPVPPPVPSKKGKGCGASAAVFILGGITALYWMLR
jgi:pSer/pThr/pTyr-binding forkhead associated (FHA) protein